METIGGSFRVSAVAVVDRRGSAAVEPWVKLSYIAELKNILHLESY